jgi:hypothetical protein
VADPESPARRSVLVPVLLLTGLVLSTTGFVLPWGSRVVGDFPGTVRPSRIQRYHLVDFSDHFELWFVNFVFLSVLVIACVAILARSLLRRGPSSWERGFLVAAGLLSLAKLVGFLPVVLGGSPLFGGTDLEPGLPIGVAGALLIAICGTLRQPVAQNPH